MVTIRELFEVCQGGGSSELLEAILPLWVLGAGGATVATLEFLLEASKSIKIQ